jgi:hypothetical protein
MPAWSSQCQLPSLLLLLLLLPRQQQNQLTHLIVLP